MILKTANASRCINTGSEALSHTGMAEKIYQRPKLNTKCDKQEILNKDSISHEGDETQRCECGNILEDFDEQCSFCGKKTNNIIGII